MFRIALVLLFTLPAYAQTMIVIRHGQSISNVQEVHSADALLSFKYPLTDLGRSQVADAAETLKTKHKEVVDKIRWVYVSPLCRTAETADILMERLGLSKDKLLVDYAIKESGFGDNEGKKANHALSKIPEYAKAHFAETDHDVSERVKTFLNRVKALHANETVLVVTHGSPMVEILKLAADEKNRTLDPRNAEFKIFSLGKEG